jgi:hypothetical protein
MALASIVHFRADILAVAIRLVLSGTGGHPSTTPVLARLAAVYR